MRAPSCSALFRVAASVAVVVGINTATPALADPPSPTPAPPASEPAPPTPPVPKDSPARILPKDTPFPPLGEKASLRKPIVWEGTRFSTFDWIITGAGAVITVGSSIVKPRSTHWTGGRLWDESARDFFRLGTSGQRFTARDISDIILSLEVTWPFFVDSLISAWWYHGSPDAAAQMASIDGKALAIVTAVHGMTTVISSRERPYGRNCGTDILPEESNDCRGSTRYRDFFSGHAATSFMGASLICMHHQKLHLYGSRTADLLSCVVAYSGAVATALLRTMGDVHYTTDILVGAAVGTAIGIGIPLLHYRKPNGSPRRPDEPPGISMTLMPFGAGLAVGGIF